MSDGKALLGITPCQSRKDRVIKVNNSDTFYVMINPSSYKHERIISFSKKKSFGGMASSSHFNNIKPDKISFEIIFDGTGVIPSGNNNEDNDVKSQLKKLDTVLCYDGSQHQPKISRLLWGHLIFFGRMESMSIDYTLFKPNGDPLRAKVSLTFTGFMSAEEEKVRANRSSPDLSHRVEVKIGDTLPQLCHQIYSDASYYLEVAKINNLNNFRQLKPGLILLFPPLK